MTRDFTKPALTVPDQIALLKRRGMVIGDADKAAHYLSHISYYRLRAYWLPFEIPATAGDHAFKAGTTFDQILELYVFDRHFRLLVLDAIERIEVSIRCAWAYHMATKYGAHGYLDQALYGQNEQYQKAMKGLKEEIGRSQDTFIKHYRENYHHPVDPPVWMVAEVLSLGQLSKWIGNLKHRADRLAISRHYGLDEKIFISLLHHLTYVRNICAHHGRLWNKQFTVTMPAPKYPQPVADAVHGAHPRRIGKTLVMLAHLLPKIAPSTAWKADVLNLIENTPTADPTEMGFPADWREHDFWRQG
jgi:abortive infection bacteriophage resistance protein